MTASNTVPPRDLQPAAPLTLTLFGPMEVLVAGQPLARMRSRKALWLLALLALRSGRSVEREWLASTLWPDSDPEQGLASLRTVLSELRQALGPEAERLQSPSRHALQLRLTDAEVDVLRFDAAISQKNVVALAQAVALYRGPLLEGCGEEWVGQERAAREQDCLRALLAVAGNAAQAEDWSAAGDFYRRASLLDPWRDAARRGLMEALARSGDINAALQVYREFVQALRSDPKAIPDEETRALYARLRAESKPKSVSPPEAKRSVPKVSGYLPHPLTEIVGREDERIEVTARMRQSRLVTLTGPGGIGKTRLAIGIAAEVVTDYPDGVWLVALDALADGSLVAGKLATVLGVKAEAGRPLLESLTDHLRHKRLLLVLDNCEHVLEASAQIARHLLQECGGVRLLATSREALGIMGETAWLVPGLSVPAIAHLPEGRASLLKVLAGYESITLFVGRAQAAQTSFQLTQNNALSVAQICTRLEGIPLAIELAAALVKVMTPEQIADRLDDHLNLLTSPTRAGPSRQQTLRATLDWSYSLMNDAERLLLRSLSLFAGGWSLEAAEAVCAGDTIASRQVVALLAALADKSLLVFDGQDAQGRYRLLETMRQYARERIDAGGESAQVKTRHRDYFLALAEEAEPELTGAEQGQWLDRLEREHENLRAALASGAIDADGARAALRLAGALQQFWLVRGHYSEGRQFFKQTLARAEAQERTAARAKALTGAGSLAWVENDYAAARALHEESLEIRRELGDTRGIADSLNSLSHVALERGEYLTARGLLEESLGIFRQLGDRRGTAAALANLGNIRRDTSDHAAAQALYEESLSLFRELGDQRNTAWLLMFLSGVARSQGDRLTARIQIEESLNLCRELGERRGEATALTVLGNLTVEEGNDVSARALLEESAGMRREMGDKRALAWTLTSLGKVRQEQRDYGPAREALSECLGHFREMGDRRGEAAALTFLGNLAHAEADDGSAQALLRDALRLLIELQDKAVGAMTLAGLAAVLLAQAEKEKAVRLLGAVHALCEVLGTPLPVYEQADYDRQTTLARATLGNVAFEAAWEEGHALPWEQAAEEALA